MAEPAKMKLPTYRRPWYLRGGHMETIWPSLFRKAPPIAYRRERISTPDDDFLDLDWLQTGCKRLAIISHGLEGNSQRHYVVGMARQLSKNGWDVLAWNFRGCGGVINRQPRMTHNGSTVDLHCVVAHALEKNNYQALSLIGFSMGGNLSLLYLGREAESVPEQVRGAVCFSVPCDLAAASRRLADAENSLYMKRFMRLMGQKVRQQAVNYPELFPCDDYECLKTFEDFDGRYTAPLHGFDGAEHYWAESSCLKYLQNIRVRSWIVNAVNDPFLAPSCFPRNEEHGNPQVSSILPGFGGHCGFATSGAGLPYWSEDVAVKLLSDC